MNDDMKMRGKEVTNSMAGHMSDNEGVGEQGNSIQPDNEVLDSQGSIASAPDDWVKEREKNKAMAQAAYTAAKTITEVTSPILGPIASLLPDKID